MTLKSDKEDTQQLKDCIEKIVHPVEYVYSAMDMRTIKSLVKKGIKEAIKLRDAEIIKIIENTFDELNKDYGKPYAHIADFYLAIISKIKAGEKDGN